MPPLRPSKEEGRTPSAIRVIGTAGHVDHGKSSLIEALTGIHPDRLKEEREREMTIDLGFGWLTLADEQEIGIVDVPGHRDFVENMLAGVAGIDAVWLVVAADEGIMPQTAEHLAIVDLLQVRGGVIVLSKIDLITEPEWLEAVEADLRVAVSGTILQDAPIVRVSARTRSGLSELLRTTGELLRRFPPRTDLGRPRLALDRVFSMEGFGTVVTGTLVDGQLRLGDEVQFLPSGTRGRVRGIQTHRRQVQHALPGSRTAVNVSGVAANQLHRGEVLVRPGQYETTRRVDARMRVLPSASTKLVHQRQVKVFLGTSTSMGTVRLLGAEAIQPGQNGWIQLEIQDPLVCARGDAFILRRPSPPETLGGGMIVDAHPAGRHRRYDQDVIGSLRALADGKPAEILLEAALSLGAAPIRELVKRSHLPTDLAAEALEHLARAGELISLEGDELSADGGQLAVSLHDLTLVCQQISEAVAAFHAKFPLRPGMPREELKSQLSLSTRALNAFLARMQVEGQLVDRGNLVAEAGHRIRFEAPQQLAIQALMRRFDESPHAPPSVKECKQAIGAEAFAALKEEGMLVALSPEVVFRGSDYESMVETVRRQLMTRGEISLADVRDLLQTSRKYAQALLENLDAVGITRRVGDVRVLAPGPAQAGEP